MPQKPFEYKIVRLNKPVGPYEVGDIFIVTPYHWYYNENGWSKDDPERLLKEAEEKEYYEANPGVAGELMKIWNTERGYLLHGAKGALILPWNEDTWDVLNIDGVDQIEEDYPQKAIEDLNRLSETREA